MTQRSDTRRKLLDGFADLLIEYGYRGLSLRSITDTLGIRRPAIYHHFPGGKQQLFVEVAETLIDDQARKIRDAIDEHDELHDQLVAIAATRLDERAAVLELRVYEATRDLDDETRTRISSRYVDGLLTPVRELMSASIEAERLAPADPDLLMRAFLEMANAARPITPEHGARSATRTSSLATENCEVVTAIFLNGARHQRPG